MGYIARSTLFPSRKFAHTPMLAGHQALWSHFKIITINPLLLCRTVCIVTVSASLVPQVSVKYYSWGTPYLVTDLSLAIIYSVNCALQHCTVYCEWSRDLAIFVLTDRQTDDCFTPCCACTRRVITIVCIHNMHKLLFSNLGLGVHCIAQHQGVGH